MKQSKQPPCEAAGRSDETAILQFRQEMGLLARQVDYDRIWCIVAQNAYSRKTLQMPGAAVFFKNLFHQKSIIRRAALGVSCCLLLLVAYFSLSYVRFSSSERAALYPQSSQTQNSGAIYLPEQSPGEDNSAAMSENSETDDVIAVSFHNREESGWYDDPASESPESGETSYVFIDLPAFCYPQRPCLPPKDDSSGEHVSIETSASQEPEQPSSGAEMSGGPDTGGPPVTGESSDVPMPPSADGNLLYFTDQDTYHRWLADTYAVTAKKISAPPGYLVSKIVVNQACGSAYYGMVGVKNGEVDYNDYIEVTVPFVPQTATLRQFVRSFYSGGMISYNQYAAVDFYQIAGYECGIAPFDAQQQNTATLAFLNVDQSLIYINFGRRNVNRAYYTQLIQALI